MKKFIIQFSIGISLLLSSASAQQAQVLEMFHGEECPHCQAQMRWLPQLEAAYPALEIRKYEVWHNAENQALMANRLNEIGETSTGVPTNIVEGEVVTGFNPEGLVALLEKNYGAPVTDRAALVAGEASGVTLTEGDAGVNWKTLIIILAATFGLIGGVFFFTGGNKSGV